MTNIFTSADINMQIQIKLMIRTKTETTKEVQTVKRK
jgi:hypothetical protein